MQLTLDYKEISKSTLKNISRFYTMIHESTSTGLIPFGVNDLPPAEKKQVIKAWMEGAKNIAVKSRQEAIEIFIGASPARRYFCKYWTPKTKEELDLADELECAIDVIEKHYDTIYPSYKRNEEGLSILKVNEIESPNGRTDTEMGIRMFRNPYWHDTSVLIQIVGLIGDYCVSIEGDKRILEKEAGCKRLFLSLAFMTIPSKAELIDALCAYPLASAMEAPHCLSNDSHTWKVFQTPDRIEWELIFKGCKH